MLSDEHKKQLIKLARETIEGYVLKGMIGRFDTKDEELQQQSGAFVTIHNNGRLRGCIGMIESKQKLYETIIEMAIQAARNDPRFEPVDEKELREIDIELSVLSQPRRINSLDEFDIENHGIILKKGFASGVFLPQVAAETGWSKEELLENLCTQKAGLPKDAYKDPNTELYVFEADVFGERAQ